MTNTSARPRALDVGVATDVGRVRDHNEDAWLADGTVHVVADGMGGHAAGEVASATAIATFRALVGRTDLTVEDIDRAVDDANDAILEAARSQPGRRGMGTTATGLVQLGSGDWAIVNIGDSRVYRWADDVLAQVTIDHSEVQELVEEGLLTREQARVHPLRNIITRSLGLDPAAAPDVLVLPPVPGERFVLCSDGLNDELDDAAIATVLRENPRSQPAAGALVAAAVAAGGHDNVTVIVVGVPGAD
ncbi:PP2C family protein-serine/threonine phosphatase [Janibacter sp. G56]|uniref:PP2C family protein-serine/threonine phosphatase n=1 Tax=Janibacter sp. G56 TaxID=3418717 RepID=UPI003D068383